VAFAFILGSLIIIALWEFCGSRRRREFPAFRRRASNIGLWTANLFLGVLLVPPPEFVRRHMEAVLHVKLPSWPIANAALSLAVGFLLLDLMAYLVHRFEHAVPLLWRFHALHHSDPDVDVTTAVRHHPLEHFFVSAVYGLALVVLNIPAVVIVSHGVATFATAAVQHGNIRLPERLERWLQPVLVTVDMHRIHHSVVFEQGNSNYGAVLSIWDRLFGTYTWISRTQHEEVIFGVRELPRRDCLRPAAMLLTPWQISRPPAID
jgi:sterol desaturase/sphingolipid hydroxylase (fatty acid hydroxylase superfamily)